ncbi:MAE_28990/MAE_18760 family HEPN-like nuclease [Veillonella atypica]|uniref:MAE_28990/MAE_18760 family HEPN-like nuclease n=1 Tax=Veillonella atypica TaxID=39777 RepID=UPI001961C824|nr:MAE_28990/MAE_18760 family HEPN-like nuclease [Veillonella atypica]VTY44234.1 Uncharacterised protein [Veillonella atypica]
MYSDIEQKFIVYKEIYKQIIPSIPESSQKKKAQTLLENSLYLSVFTTFEWFIRTLIDDYVIKVSERGICFNDLSPGIARYVFLGHERRIKDLFNKSSDNQVEAFCSYYRSLKNNFTANQLRSYIRFEFFHEHKLNGYYKDLFEQVLGNREFLTELMITTCDDNLNPILETRQSASQFLVEFTGKVRNNIAHENSEFVLSDDDYDFNSVIYRFLQIVKGIEDAYIKYTGFEISLPKENLLDIAF